MRVLVAERGGGGLGKARGNADAKRTGDELAASGLPMDTLSMGMSGDFESAIAEGSTMVRIGTAIRKAVEA